MIKPVTTFAVLFMLLAQAATSFGAQEKDKAGPDEEKNKIVAIAEKIEGMKACLLYTSPSPRDKRQSRMPSSA